MNVVSSVSWWFVKNYGWRMVMMKGDDGEACKWRCCSCPLMKVDYIIFLNDSFCLLHGLWFSMV